MRGKSKALERNPCHHRVRHENSKNTSIRIEPAIACIPGEVVNIAPAGALHSPCKLLWWESGGTALLWELEMSSKSRVGDLLLQSCMWLFQGLLRDIIWGAPSRFHHSAIAHFFYQIRRKKVPFFGLRTPMGYSWDYRWNVLMLIYPLPYYVQYRKTPVYHV